MHTRLRLQEGGWSAVYNFTTPPAPNASADDAPLRLLLAADMGHWAPDAAYDADSILFEAFKLLPSVISRPNAGACLPVMACACQRLERTLLQRLTCMRCFAGSIPYTIMQSAVRMLVRTDRRNGGSSARDGMHAAHMTPLLGALRAQGGTSPQPGAEAVMAGLAAELASADTAGRPYHGLLVNGDISYACGESAQWLAWLHQMQDVLRRVPAMYSSGNHEVGGHAAGWRAHTPACVRMQQQRR